MSSKDLGVERNRRCVPLHPSEATSASPLSFNIKRTPAADNPHLQHPPLETTTLVLLCDLCEVAEEDLADTAVPSLRSDVEVFELWR
jgi:hypothetical protein